MDPPRQARPDTVTRPLAQVRVYPETKTASGGLARLEEIESMVRRHGRSRLPRQFWPEMVRESRRAIAREVRARNWSSARHPITIFTRYAFLRAAVARRRSACGRRCVSVGVWVANPRFQGPRAATPTRLATGPLLASFRCGHGACPGGRPATARGVSGRYVR